LFRFRASIITIALSASTSRRRRRRASGGAQSGAEDEPKMTGSCTRGTAAVLRADGVGGPEEGGQLVIGEHVRQARAGPAIHATAR